MWKVREMTWSELPFLSRIWADPENKVLDCLAKWLNGAAWSKTYWVLFWKEGFVFCFSSRRRHTRYWRDWSSDVCSSDLDHADDGIQRELAEALPAEPCRQPHVVGDAGCVLHLLVDHGCRLPDRAAPDRTATRRASAAMSRARRPSPFQHHVRSDAPYRARRADRRLRSALQRSVGRPRVLGGRPPGARGCGALLADDRARRRPATRDPARRRRRGRRDPLRHGPRRAE